jgi:hypothetical protein
LGLHHGGQRQQQHQRQQPSEGRFHNAL